MYDREWNRIHHNLKNFGEEKVNDDIIFPKPKCLTKMVEMASVLSKGQPEMRVDMYIVNGKPIVGELTMSSGYGYFTEDYYNYLGNLVDVSLLPKKK